MEKYTKEKEELNELRLIANDIIAKLATAKAKGQIEVLKMHCESSIKRIDELEEKEKEAMS